MSLNQINAAPSRNPPECTLAHVAEHRDDIAPVEGMSNEDRCRVHFLFQLSDNGCEVDTGYLYAREPTVQTFRTEQEWLDHLAVLRDSGKRDQYTMLIRHTALAAKRMLGAITAPQAAQY